MAWNIEITPEAQKNLKKLGTQEAQRILKFLYDRLRLTENPRETGKPLKGIRLENLWRYRVGDYRIFCRIEDAKICILVLEIGHRSKIYDEH